MDLNSPETWRWIWLVMVMVFAASELASAMTFFFLPWAIGAAVATVITFAGGSVGLSWVAFTIISIAGFAGFWPLARRMERADGEQEGVGATRWVGQEALVVETIKENGIGAVRLEREQWRAESLSGKAIQKGTAVLITRMNGTRLVVAPLDEIPAGESNQDLSNIPQQHQHGDPNTGPNQGV